MVVKNELKMKWMELAVVYSIVSILYLLEGTERFLEKPSVKIFRI
jgi:hypothetical protein